MLRFFVGMEVQETLLAMLRYTHKVKTKMIFIFSNKSKLFNLFGVFNIINFPIFLSCAHSFFAVTNVLHVISSNNLSNLRVKEEKGENTILVKSQ